MLRWLLLAAAMVLPALPALAQQPPCGPVEVVLKALYDEAKEVPAGMGRDERGFIAVLTLSPDGSYSVLGIRPDGVACVISTGQGWEAIARKPADKGG